jgi:glycine reductase
VSKLINICLVTETDPSLTVLDQNDAVHKATLLVCDRLAALTRDLDAPDKEIFELKPVDPSLPRVVYVPCLHSAGAMSGGSANGFFCTTTTYGLSQLTSPWVLHPNEIIDGAITGPYRIASSWHLANNPILLELYRRHGVDVNFVGVIAVRTEWTTMAEKDLMCMQTAKTAQMLGAQGAVVAWDAAGNEFLEAIRTVRACERAGIKTVFMTMEDDATGGAPTLLEPHAEADAIVSVYMPPFQPSTLPGVQRMIGSGTMLTGAVRDEVKDVSGPLPPPVCNDPYGFGRLSGVDY